MKGCERTDKRGGRGDTKSSPDGVPLSQALWARSGVMASSRPLAERHVGEGLRRASLWAHQLPRGPPAGNLRRHLCTGKHSLIPQLRVVGAAL